MSRIESGTEFEVVAEYPISISDRKRRGAGGNPSASRPVGVGHSGLAPRNETEHIIGRICQELLGIEPIGVRDNFFEPGGQSLLATQVVAPVRTAFEDELPMRRFFEGPTVAQLALAVAQEPEHTAERAEAAHPPPAGILAI
jgi:Phosphopantetheine attachment site